MINVLTSEFPFTPGITDNILGLWVDTSYNILYRKIILKHNTANSLKLLNIIFLI